MKIFVYKTLFVILCVFILFQFTIGAKIRNYESQIKNLTNDQGREDIRNKLREEIKKANKKDQILSTEDRKILKEWVHQIFEDEFKSESETEEDEKGSNYFTKESNH